LDPSTAKNLPNRQNSIKKTIDFIVGQCSPIARK